ncbi:tetratricopeptide repeat protein [Breznakiella homolactica]|uniref:Tetratricopeptide repeat protein n=1 Tax=Breznakiella homolactica TaxID=2798577 RepID=A0A7T7XJT7_9SPIR|nr:tetratricopeptide repeat protein [Breznakiella homolactica]QQO07553.1 tetratricopeptide repeat protein [Breznakiella homolactica]
MAASGGAERLREAVQAGVRRDYTAAAAILEQLISETDAPPEVYLFLGRSLHALGEYSRAAVTFRDYIRLVPRSYLGYFFAGRTYISLGMPGKAVPLLQKALSKKPKDPQIMAILGVAYLKSKHSLQAVESLEAAVLTDPDNKRIYRAYLNALFIRGIRLIRSGNPGLGAQMLTFVLDNGVDIPLLRIELGRAYRDMDMPEEALEHFSVAVEYAPRDPRLRWYRASVLMAMDRSGDALEEIERIRSLDGDLPDLPWNSELIDQYIITSLMQDRQWRKAADACREWIKYRGPDPEIHGIYAEALRSLGEFQAAQNHLSRALELAPENLSLRYAQMAVSWEAGDSKTLGKAIQAAVRLDGDEDLITKYSILYESKNSEDLTTVLTLLQDGVRAFGPDTDLMYTLGEQYLKVGFIDEAAGWFRKTRETETSHQRSYLGEIAAFEALVLEGSRKDRGNLKKSYVRYLALWPDNRTIRREYALFLIHVCEFPEAAAELETLLAREPANPTLRRVLAYAYRKSGRFRDASVLLKGLLKERPKDTGLLLEFTGCLERAGSVYYASLVLEKAMPLFKKSPDIPLALGMLYFRDKKIEAAFDMLRESAGRDTGDPRPYQWMAAIARQHGTAGDAAQYEYEAKRRKNSVKK